MGQQQLLLIVLGVIIVGVAVVVGINLFSTNSRLEEGDNISIEAQAIAHMAIIYYKKPKSTGGGGRSFLGFKPSRSIATDISGSEYTLSGIPASLYTDYEINFYTKAGVYSMTGTAIHLPSGQFLELFQIQAKSHKYPFGTPGFFYVSVIVRMSLAGNGGTQISTTVNYVY
jgi:hypothetical protein